MNFFRIFTLFFLLLFLAPVQESYAAPKDKKIHATWYAGRKYVSMADTARYYGMKMSIRGTTITFSSKYSRIEFNTKKRAGVFNGTKINWFYVPVKKNNAWYFSEQDLLLQLDPLLRKKALARRPVRTIMIDPGHGGKDTGAIGVNKKKEKDVTLAIALKLRRKLIRMGYSVRLTRAGDSFPSLEQRVKTCKNARPKPDLYISIHCNSAGNAKVQGIETFAATPYGVPSTADAKPEFKTYAGNAYNKYNICLAYDMQRALRRYLPASPDRGVKHARFYVIRNVSCPAILIETGFLSNWSECTNLSSNAYQDRVATAILSGILTYAARVR